MVLFRFLAQILFFINALSFALILEAAFIPKDAVDSMWPKCPESCRCDERTFTICEFNPDLIELTYDFQGLATKHLRFQGPYSHLPLIKGSSQIHSLTFFGTKIEHLKPKYFEEFQFLEVLDFSSNNLKSLSANVFWGLDILHSLNLSHNAIEPSQKFKFFSSETKYLMKLDLSYNRFVYIDEFIFEKMLSLESLDLSFNKIGRIHPKAFESLRNLKELKLNENSLITLNPTVMSPLTSLNILILSNNPWECSCATIELLEFLKNNSMMLRNANETTCSQPAAYQGHELLFMSETSELPCLPPEIVLSVTKHVFLARNNIVIPCKIAPYPQAHVYWKTPLGQIFSHKSTGVEIHLPNATVKQMRRYYHPFEGINTIDVLLNGSLYIENFHGWMRGNYTCFAVNNWGHQNITIEVEIATVVYSLFFTSLYFGGIGPVVMILLAIVVWLLKLCVLNCRCCCCCCRPKENKTRFKFEIDANSKDGTHGSCVDSEDKSFLSDPENSKFITGTLSGQWVSPKKCPTPIGEQEISDGWRPTGTITDTLDEVRVRLEKKVERMKKNVQSIRESSSQHLSKIKESGSQYISTIKDTSSQAANRVRAGMVLGVEQVKSGMMSFKEFCGTGDMGTGTISVISVSTDIDSQEQTKVIKTVTTL